MNSNLIWITNHKSNSTAAHTHDFYQMIFCKKSGGIITIGNTSFSVRQDYVYFAKPGIMHSVTKQKNMQTIDLNFSVNDEQTKKYLSNVPEEFQINDVVLMKMLFLFISREASESKINSNETINHALKVLLNKIIDEFNDTTARMAYDQCNQYNIDKSYTATDNMILELKDYIEENINKDINLDELANKVHLSKTYFVKKFKILFGLSPMKYISGVRIGKAKQMIIEGKLSIQQISDLVGYNSLHHFSAAFKQSVGLSPTEYQKYFNSE